MATASLALLAVAALIALVPLAIGLGLAVGAYRRYRGTRLVVCPQRLDFSAVQVDAFGAALTAPYGRPDLRLKSCTHWPQGWPCGQKCLAQIAAAPEACLVRNILTGWYEGKSCVYCHRAIGAIRWHDHAPALRSPLGPMVEWKDLPPERLVDVLATHLPVCWSCHVAERFRREHPERVTDRDRSRPARSPEP